ncbi:hypothetical protein [Chamaesiphon sp. OTE_75_metabat_556]|uniref:hypothetical protein n=1 Tax=Chamaesiphon sp. OTE_75_metabat_556 TaxID=2964692 RepID=UPI00286D2CE1|nr:hypothetical protein [Chamaesiphon sp. OTE_75_metabat_556]
MTSKSKGYVTNLKLMLFGFGTAIFPRVIAALKIPSVINFLHFFAIPFACASVLINSRSKNRKQLALSKSLLVSLFLLLIVVFASALINQAGIINIVLDYLLLTEPFILILTIVSIPMTADSYQYFRDWILRAALSNTLFAYVQKYIFHMENLYGQEDNIKGIYIGQGAGHVISGSVAMTFAIYYFVNAKNKPLWFRIAILLVCLNQIIISDTKQVLVSFIVGYVMLYFLTFKNLTKAVLYLFAGLLVLGVFYWAIYNFEFLSAYKTWIRPELYGPDGEANRLKLATFRIVPQYFHSPLNWWLGLGPGHTIGRLGGWMLTTYWDLFAPLGATVHPASKEIWMAVANSWLGDQSSMFSPLFGWAGIWGDLGLLGLGSYFYIAVLVWRKVCLTDTAKYLMLTVFVFGTIFSQLEEPGYTLIVASLIGLDWQSRQIIAQKQMAVVT